MTEKTNRQQAGNPLAATTNTSSSNNSTETPLLQAARDYTGLGFSVIPIKKGEKRPAISWERWQTERPDDAQLVQWFANGKHEALGVVTGAVSNGLVILDFDGEGWQQASNDFLTAFPDLLETCMVRSGSGKLHIWLTTEDLTGEDGKPITQLRFSRPDLGDKTAIEVRANNVQTLVPPSLHPSGGRYEFLNDNAILQLDTFQPILTWLREWEQSSTTELETDLSMLPELPASAQLPEQLGRDASPWLDNYIALSRRWSPRAYDGFHEAIGVWVLSVIAARRVALHLGGLRYPSLYIALVSKTSLYAKSTTADIGIDTLRTAGLDWLLASDDATPQKFISDLTRKVPDNYAVLPSDQQSRIQSRLALAAQRGWFYEEFGQKLAAMLKESGFMADFRGILRRFWDCPERYEYGTIARGTDTVEHPYIALLANCTPADMRNAANRGNALWNDGFLARFALVCPPQGTRSRARFPEGERVIPPNITLPLVNWHKRLGIPPVTLNDSDGEYSVTVGDHLPQVCELGENVRAAFYNYHDALSDLIAEESSTPDVDGNLTRLAEMALRIAMLLASLENDGHIELRHWARAQAITERWRASLYELYAQVNRADSSEEAALEEKIYRAIRQLGGRATAAQIARYIWSKSSTEIADQCERMCRTGALKSSPAGKWIYYEEP
mgnify:CR=1 FL=1